MFIKDRFNALWITPVIANNTGRYSSFKIFLWYIRLGAVRFQIYTTSKLKKQILVYFKNDPRKHQHIVVGVWNKKYQVY